MRSIGIFAAFCAMVAAPAQAADVPILIFGGPDHDVFLGCLNCSETDKNSVWDKFSNYGWANAFGIWGQFGKYGAPFGTTSACNEFASDPPVLLDQEGNSYGHLSVNRFNKDSVCSLLGVEPVCRMLKVMCAHKV